MTDQTLGLPAGRPRTARLRSIAANVLRRIELRPTTSWAVAALIGSMLTRYFWIDEGTFPNILFTVAVTLALIAILGPDDAPGAVCDCAGGLARGADRGDLLGQAGRHEHGPARLRHRLLSELLVDGQLSVERPAPLPRGPRRRAARRGRRRPGSPTAPTARAFRAAGPRWLCRCASRSPGTAPTPRASAGTCSSTTRTCTSRPSTRPGARRSRRCGAVRCWRRRRTPRRRAPAFSIPTSCHVGDQAAAHHPDP